ncbi:DNA-binding Lrp family transcriptional regulator [Rhizobium sp. BK650]|nr:DNA-binding Lrp family transcriptional regulator [Rhizobium sp. BK650]
MTTFEPVEIKILSNLQSEGRLTNQELSERVGMSTSPCWRKVRQLEDTGVIQGYRADLNRRNSGSEFSLSSA